ncbi:MAG: sulfur carrier protein ThiS adenylyltransferase ThiF [Candidatus Hydrogenedentes bacterium]|nr:sulfur carrier protein ThiS adenylyltransferase ThiF [Candidatus Hydrogenedentota bacterium]
MSFQRKINIYVNEKRIEVELGTKVIDLYSKVKPDADIVILNGFPLREKEQYFQILKENDRVVLIRRGEIPSKDELESLIVARHTPGVYEKLKKASVGIAGLGGLGSNVAISLARVGIGKLILVDFDVVEPSNLNRQQYGIKHIGMLKTEAIKEILFEINPYVNIITFTEVIDENNIQRLFSEADILVEAFDSPEGKKMLIETFHKYFPSRPLISASGLAGFYSSNSIKVRKVTKYLYVVGDECHSAGIGEGLMSPRVGITANMQANTVVRIIMGEEQP